MGRIYEYGQNIADPKGIYNNIEIRYHIGHLSGIKHALCNIMAGGGKTSEL